MKFKINHELLPIKFHFFFFFAALGPILPQLNVFGRQLGVSAAVMGLVTAVLPLLWAVAKPLFGYVVDYWPSQRKLIFMLLITTMTGSYCGLWFLPMLEEPSTTEPFQILNLNDTVYIKPHTIDNTTKKYKCHWSCSMVDFDVYLSNLKHIDTLYFDGRNISCSLYGMNYIDDRKGEVTCSPKSDCNMICYDEFENGTFRDGTRSNGVDSGGNVSSIDIDRVVGTSGSFYMTAVFWMFVIFMCVGTVAFNVANCIGDAVCFDVLGQDRASRYGSQRAWGTTGYGLTALLGGWLVNTMSSHNDMTPAFLIAIFATGIDLYSCRKLTLPPLSSPSDSGKALKEVLKIPRVIVFIVFAVIAGTFDSFIIYYMFWYLEELAEQTGTAAKIKLIEGVVVAGQSFIGELLFFFLSGKIIKRFGYGATLTASLFCYGIRMGLISLITHPWQLLFIEAIMQGPTYALCYSSIVGYAAHVAPAGYSATVQGLVAGVDDGLGFALGSLVGGQLYSHVGGRRAFVIFACVAIAASIVHGILFVVVTREDRQGKSSDEPIEEEGEKMLTIVQNHSNTIYSDTVVPIQGEKIELR